MVITAAYIAGNREEYKKMNIIKILVDLLNNDRNVALLALFSHILTALTLYLDDKHTISSFAELQGIVLLTKLLLHNDNQVKKRAYMALSKTLQFDEFQGMVRDTGVIGKLPSQLISPDPIISFACSIFVTALARNETNLQELLKLGILEILIKHIKGEQRETKRQCMAALSFFAVNPTAKTKFQTSPDWLLLINKVLQCDDTSTIENTCYCVIALWEDGLKLINNY
jgi:hypothetical protein